MKFLYRGSVSFALKNVCKIFEVKNQLISRRYISDCGGSIDLSSSEEKNGTIYSLQYFNAHPRSISENCIWILKKSRNATISFHIVSKRKWSHYSCPSAKISIVGNIGEDGEF